MDFLLDGLLAGWTSCWMDFLLDGLLAGWTSCWMG
jgi:hypothetical protein